MEFSDVKSLFARVYSDLAAPDFFIFRRVSPASYEAIYKARERRDSKLRLDLYNPEDQTLCITRPTTPHERAHRVLDDLILAKLFGMGITMEWAADGASTYGERTRGEGDSARRPFSRRPSSEMWPTLVIEAGYHQFLPRLREKKTWWFRESRYQVKIVILAKLFRRRRRILVEKWIEVPAQAGPGVQTRAQTAAFVAATLTPTCRQTIEITTNPGTTTAAQIQDPGSYSVTSDPLTLEFDLLFLRPPLAGERDISVGAQDLRDYASRVWSGIT